jgi:Nucleotidyltransferase domain
MRLCVGVLQRRTGMGLPGSRLPESVEADRYVASVVRKYAISDGGPAVRAGEALLPLIREWAGKRLWGVELSGSYAKGTATSLGTDVDLFISLGPDGTPVKESFWSLVEFCVARGLKPQVRDVSVRVVSGGYKVDWCGRHGVLTRFGL